MAPRLSVLFLILSASLLSAVELGFTIQPRFTGGVVHRTGDNALEEIELGFIGFAGAELDFDKPLDVVGELFVVADRTESVNSGIENKTVRLDIGLSASLRYTLLEQSPVSPYGLLGFHLFWWSMDRSPLDSQYPDFDALTSVDLGLHAGLGAEYPLWGPFRGLAEVRAHARVPGPTFTGAIGVIVDLDHLF